MIFLLFRVELHEIFTEVYIESCTSLVFGFFAPLGKRYAVLSSCSVVECWQLLLLPFTSIKFLFLHILREANQPRDPLAGHGLSMIVGDRLFDVIPAFFIFICNSRCGWCLF